MTEKHPLDDADLDFGDGEDFEGEPDEDFDDGEDFEGDDDIGDDEDGMGDDDDGMGDDDDEAESEEDDDDIPLPADDDDDEDVHPSDVEADLEEILRDRIAASDDDEEDEEEAPGQAKAAPSVAPPRSDEWTCNQCFLIVSMTQFGSRANPVCPSGEEPCESIERIFRG